MKDSIHKIEFIPLIALILYCSIIYSLFQFNSPSINYLLAILMIALIAIRKNFTFKCALIILTVSIMNSSFSSGHGDEAISANSIITPIGSITFLEIFIFFFIISNLKLINDINNYFEYSIWIIIAIFIGGVICSLNAKEEQITSWSGGFRGALVFLGYIAAPSLMRVKSIQDFPYQLSQVSIIVFYVGLLLFNKGGHLVFLIPASYAVFALYQGIKWNYIFIFINILILALFGYELTLTLIISIITSSLLLYIYKSPLRIKKLTLIIFLLIVCLIFFTLLIFIDEIFFIFHTHYIEKGSFYNDPMSFCIHKIGDRVQLWKPFLDHFMEDPFEMIYNTEISYTNILRLDNKEFEWNTHAHNGFITALVFYGPIAGGLILVFTIQIFYKVVKNLEFFHNQKSKYAAFIFFMSVIPGILFGNYPFEVNIGHIFWLMAGFCILNISKGNYIKKNEDFTFGSRKYT